MRILVIEDEPKIAQAVKKGLELKDTLLTWFMMPIVAIHMPLIPIMI